MIQVVFAEWVCWHHGAVTVCGDVATDKGEMNYKGVVRVWAILLVCLYIYLYMCRCMCLCIDIYMCMNMIVSCIFIFAHIAFVCKLSLCTAL